MSNVIHFHVKRGDVVEVISGNHKGATGKILQILAAKQQVLIEGVRIIKKHTKRSQNSPQGAIVEREGPHPHFQREARRGRHQTRFKIEEKGGLASNQQSPIINHQFSGHGH